jgi:hypothetical protein
LMGAGVALGMGAAMVVAFLVARRTRPVAAEIHTG